MNNNKKTLKFEKKKKTKTLIITENHFHMLS